MKAVLVLGCEGRQDNGFQFCNGVENIILDFEKYKHRDTFLGMVKYLDSVPKLFDSPCCINNIITNTIFKIHDMGFISTKDYEKISYFYKSHLYCGLVLKMIPKE